MQRLMVQGKLSHLSHALPAPSCSMVSGCKDNAHCSPVNGKSQGVRKNAELHLITIILLLVKHRKGE